MTARAKHTPGPWEIRMSNPNPRIISPTGLVTVINDRSQVGATDANAQLIAAAPEMLKQLQYTVKCLQEHLSQEAHDEETTVEELCPCWGEAVEPALVLIAKALGD